MNLLITLLVNTIAVIVAAYILPNVEVDSITTALLVAVVLGVLNMFIRPILTILTLPLTILTLGLFTFVINALLILAADWLIEGFRVDGFIWALIFSLVVSLVGAFLNTLLKDK